MPKGKNPRVTVILECTSCVRNGADKKKESQAFLDILLKRIDTIHLVNWN